MAGLLFLAQFTNLDLKALQFRSEAGSAANQYIVMAILGVLVVAAAVAVYAYIRRRGRLEELNRQREETRLKLMLSELNLDPSELELLQTLLQSEEPSDIVQALESRSAFEQALLAFRAAQPGHPAQKRVSQLRQRLEYGFNNIRNPFIDTRMLAPGTRMQCRIKLPKRQINFLTTLLGANEEHLIIRPPTAKGKPVELSGIGRLYFRVSRENDAEYEFSCAVLAQMPTGARAVLLEHTHEISRMLFRHAARLTTDLPGKFYVIRQELTAERSAASLKVLDSQFVFDGSIKDLSTGGALLFARGQQQGLHEGDVIVFRLPGAQIRDDMVSQVTGLMPLDDGQTQIHLQFVGLRELNRLKLSKYLSILRENPPLGAEEEARPPSVAS